MILIIDVFDGSDMISIFICGWGCEYGVAPLMPINTRRKKIEFLRPHNKIQWQASPLQATF
jgi:hypothetical protein